MFVSHSQVEALFTDLVVTTTSSNLQSAMTSEHVSSSQPSPQWLEGDQDLDFVQVNRFLPCRMKMISAKRAAKYTQLEGTSRDIA